MWCGLYWCGWPLSTSCDVGIFTNFPILVILRSLTSDLNCLGRPSLFARNTTAIFLKSFRHCHYWMKGETCDYTHKEPFYFYPEWLIIDYSITVILFFRILKGIGFWATHCLSTWDHPLETPQLYLLRLIGENHEVVGFFGYFTKNKHFY